MLTIKAHFDGKVLVPDEPLDLETDQAVELQVKPVGPPARRSMHELIGRVYDFPPNPNPTRTLTDDEIWNNPEKGKPWLSTPRR